MYIFGYSSEYLSDVYYALISGGKKELRHSLCPQGVPCLAGDGSWADIFVGVKPVKETACPKIQSWEKIRFYRFKDLFPFGKTG